MTFRSKKILACSLFTYILLSCSDPAPQVPYNKIEREDTEGSLVEMNRQFALIEDSLINDYVEKNSLSFKTTKSGLRYVITDKGNGKRIREADKVTFRYSVAALDSVPSDKMKNVVKTIDYAKSDIKRGFREALSLMTEDGVGIFVMPSFLAYGVVGVPGCIGPWTPVVCKITLIEIESDK